jgi:hypothetical protein
MVGLQVFRTLTAGSVDLLLFSLMFGLTYASPHLWARQFPSEYSRVRRYAWGTGGMSGRTVSVHMHLRRPHASIGWKVAGVRPVTVRMWRGRAKSRCRCCGGEPSPSMVAGVSPVLVRWQG